MAQLYPDRIKKHKNIESNNFMKSPCRVVNKSVKNGLVHFDRQGVFI